MHRWATIALLATATVSLAESFDERLARGNALLRSGDVERATDAYRELQVEEPESRALYYAMGCAHYESALESLGLKDAPSAKQAFSEAQSAFEQALAADDPEMRKNAAFNEANCRAQQALLTVGAGDGESTINAFEYAIAKYEDCLKRYPDHKGLQQNLDHMRYRLKKLLQNPPPPQQQNDQDQQQQEQQEQKDDQQQQQGKQEGQNQQEQQEESEEREQQPQEQEERQDENGRSSDEQQESDQQPESGASEAAQDEDSDSTETQEPQSLDRQSVEAILDSIEERDQREQRQIRSGPRDTRLRTEWW